MSKFTTVLSGGVLAAAAAFSLGAPASAATAPAGVSPMGHPAGCSTAHFCSYRDGNGGRLCYNTTSSIKSWSTSCREVDSVFNNGAAAAARLYYGTSYTGAHYCLASGHYLLYMTKNTFNVGAGKSGYQQPMANHVKSHTLGVPCGS
jgi:hypothetical protein